MVDIKRRSAVRFNAGIAETEVRDHWTVALAYENEGPGPWLIDLGHKTRWDLQDANVGEQTPCGLAVPGTPGACALENGILINRMNRTQAAVWHLNGTASEMPDFSGYTDVTESTVFLALVGPHVYFITEKLTALDFMSTAKTAPFLLQGPFCHVPCQMVALDKRSDGSGGLVMTCSRGYADSLVHAIMDAGAEFGLSPAGESRFSDWLSGLNR